MRGLVWAGLLLACAGAEVVGPGGEEPEPRPEPEAGAVWVENRTPFALEVVYLNAVEAAHPRIVRTRVESGQRQEVSGGALPGGWETEFDVVLLLPEEQGFRVRRKARVRVDGEVVLAAFLGAAGDPFSARVEVEAGQT